VSLGDERRQKTAQAVLPLEGRGEAPSVERSGEAPPAANRNEHPGTGHGLMELVVEGGNVKAALRRVKQNKGSPGVDGMTVDELPTWLVTGWSAVREQLLAGTYCPVPVREQEIPKSGGGVRKLGIPTVLDRLIQRCILQVLQPRFDPGFSEHSYGFRPGCSAHQAVCAAQRYIQEGRRVVVDVDLEKFFDRVNHDRRLEKRLGDKRMLGLIRRYLEAGIMANGVVVERYEGTPQGGPLSPLLANVLLDEVDKELERRGLAFARYADDCNVYVRSRRAGERGLADAAAPVRAAPAPNQRVEECSRPTVEPEVPRLQFLGSPGAEGETEGRAEGPRSDEGAGPGHHRPERGSEHGRRDEGAAGVPHRLEGVLSTGGDPTHLQRPGRMGPSPPPTGPAQTVEAGTHHLPGAHPARRAG